jgi:glycosyltransferase involved in cell wall biosynthesis
MIMHQVSGRLSARRILRIGFLDLSGWDFHALTPDTSPLGGTQSAACYLARALAAQGHQITLLSNVREPGIHGGVASLMPSRLQEAGMRALRLDACVVILSAGMGVRYRRMLGRETRLVFWTQHAVDQPGVQGLRERSEVGAYDRFVFVSQWQAAGFAAVFGVPRERMAILPNAMAPAFENMYPVKASITASKSIPPVLAYTSTPFRGLALLLDAFPRIREAVPGVRLRVYSSMKVYQTPAHEDEANYGVLYDRCRRTEGVEYVGSIGQAELARQMREVTFLAYPNTFPETFCIAALEALAAGCRVVTSRLGALPETTAGYAELLEFGSTEEDLVKRLVDAVVGQYRRMRERPEEAEVELRRQVDYVNRECIWAVRARQWGELLGRLCEGG